MVKDRSGRAVNMTASQVNEKRVPCYLCGKLVDDDDTLCAGCNANICEECEVTGVMGFGHEPIDHKEY